MALRIQDILIMLLGYPDIPDFNKSYPDFSRNFPHLDYFIILTASKSAAGELIQVENTCVEGQKDVFY